MLWILIRSASAYVFVENKKKLLTVFLENNSFSGTMGKELRHLNVKKIWYFHYLELCLCF